MSNNNPVFDMNGVARRLADCGVSLSDASTLIAYQSRGKIFVSVDGDDLLLKKHFQPYKGAPVEQVIITPRDFKNVCVWLNDDARAKGIDLALRASQ